MMYNMAMSLPELVNSLDHVRYDREILIGKAPLELWESEEWVSQIVRSEDERVALEKMGRALGKHRGTTGEMMRFLRMHKLHHEKSVREWVRYIKWRSGNGIDKILDAPVAKHDVMSRLVGHWLPQEHHDVDGRPIYIERTGQIDMKLLIQLVPEADVVRNHIVTFEALRRLAHENAFKLKKPVYDALLVNDLAGLNLFAKEGLHLLNAVVKVDESFYPDLVGRSFLVRGPWVFSILWSMVKPLLGELLRQKVNILGSNYLEQLGKAVAPEHLPVEYGGTLEAEVTKYEAENFNVKEHEPEWNEQLVPAGKDFEHKVETRELGTTVMWVFRTKSRDIKFSVRFVPDGVDDNGDAEESKEEESKDNEKGDKIVRVVPLAKANSQNFRQEGSYTATGKGTIVLRWDNTFSYINGKSLLYFVTAIHQDENTKNDDN